MTGTFFRKICMLKLNVEYMYINNKLSDISAKWVLLPPPPPSYMYQYYVVFYTDLLTLKKTTSNCMQLKVGIGRNFQCLHEHTPSPSFVSVCIFFWRCILLAFPCIQEISCFLLSLTSWWTQDWFQKYSIVVIWKSLLNVNIKH